VVQKCIAARHVKHQEIVLLKETIAQLKQQTRESMAQIERMNREMEERVSQIRQLQQQMNEERIRQDQLVRSLQKPQPGPVPPTRPRAQVKQKAVKKVVKRTQTRGGGGGSCLIL